VNDEDSRLLAELLRVLGESDPWIKRVNSAVGEPGPAARSPMREDDDRLDPYHPSHAARHSLAHAVDHLICLQAPLGGAPAGPYVRAVLAGAGGAGELVRGGVDAAAAAQV
jgi:hypothetical protein